MYKAGRTVEIVIFLLSLFFLHATDSRAQHSIKAVIINAENKEPLPQASFQMDTTLGVSANMNGEVELSDIPPGTHQFITRFVGFKEKILTLSFPLKETIPIIIALYPDHEELEEVIITTTRSSRSIQSIPTRVEFIGAEELEEKITMQPGNIRMVLSESTGIQTQQTSVSSANTTIRIQGLDGRYTQLLKDGFPLFGGFSGGLSIMQIPPLDLQQVDLIKGSASTLYGGGAIAGLVNLISKQPKEDRDLLFFANGTSARGLDLSTYYGEKFSKIGVTVFASRNSNAPYDPAKMGFSAIPEFERYTINPRLFVYPDDKTTLMAGLNSVQETRTGGDMQYLKGNGDALHSFYEKNKTNRNSTQLSVTRKLKHNTTLNIKNSFNFFEREINQRDYQFGGKQLSSFSEVTFEKSSEKTEWVWGANLWTDNFREDERPAISVRDFKSTTAGAFVQNVSELNESLVLETGLRIDHAFISAKNNGSLSDWIVLPRISMLIRWNKKFSSRIGGGLGYKIPTIFTEKAEEQVFENVQPMDFSSMRMEKSYGSNADLNFQTLIGEDWSISLNQLFFYTRLRTPLIFEPAGLDQGIFTFQNADGHTDAIGTESNVKLEFRDFKLYLGYTFVDALNHFQEKRVRFPLTARNRINSVLLYEVEGSLRIGLEAFYFSPQTLTNGRITDDYWIVGFSAQKKWHHFSVFANFENFTDTRQTRFENINNGSVTDPVFSEIYAPLDGFVFNAGFLITLGSEH
jgi:outer membrane receptor for ferrienterochelin and colicins